MSLLRALTGMVIETAKLPLDVAKDFCTLGGAIDGQGSAVVKRLEKIKEESGQ